MKKYPIDPSNPMPLNGNFALGFRYVIGAAGGNLAALLNNTMTPANFIASFQSALNYVSNGDMAPANIVEAYMPNYNTLWPTIEKNLSGTPLQQISACAELLCTTTESFNGFCIADPQDSSTLLANFANLDSATSVNQALTYFANMMQAAQHAIAWSTPNGDAILAKGIQDIAAINSGGIPAFAQYAKDTQNIWNPNTAQSSKKTP